MEKKSKHKRLMYTRNIFYYFLYIDYVTPKIMK